MTSRKRSMACRPQMRFNGISKRYVLVVADVSDESAHIPQLYANACSACGQQSPVSASSRGSNQSISSPTDVNSRGIGLSSMKAASMYWSQ